MKNNQIQLPEQLRYYIKNMKDTSSNSGTRVQYKTILVDIIRQLQDEIEDFDKNQVFRKKTD